MAILRKKEIREMNEKQLKEKLKELKLELAKERGAVEVGSAKNPGRIREIRKTIARINTFLNNKNRGEK
jgi:large subunit ribosomal protein L29